MDQQSSTSYQNVGRYSKGYEPQQDFGAVLDGFHRISKEEAEATFGTGGTVPEGTCVKLAAPGTAKTKNSVYIEYVEGDLEICDADDSEVFGITAIQVIDPAGSRPDYVRPKNQTSAFYGELIGVAVNSHYGFLSNFSANVADIKQGTAMYVGNYGRLSTAGVNGVPAVPTGKKVATIIGKDRVAYSFSTGLPLVGASPQDILIRAYLSTDD